MSDEYKIFTHIDPANIPDLIEVVNRKYEAGKYWAEAVSVYNALEKRLSIELARIKQKIRIEYAPPEGKKSWSADDLDDAAKSTEEYEQFVNMLNDAHKEMLKAINEKATWENTFDSVRSIAATERELHKGLK